MSRKKTKTKAFKSDYARLFDDPTALFGEGVQVRLWPNGVPEIWIKAANGSGGYAIRCSGGGKVGFGLTIRCFVGSQPMTVCAHQGEEPAVFADARELDICQYKPDERSQKFKLWYQGKGPYPEPLEPEPAQAPNLAGEAPSGEALAQMGAFIATHPEARYAAYQNHDLGSGLCGHLKFLAVGPGCTFESAPKPTLPDTRTEINWRYQFIGWVNLSTGLVEPEKASA